MGYPAGIHIIEREGVAPDAPAVVLTHGSLDRAESFRRAMRRLPALTIVAYDRRGYQGSRGAGVVGLSGHIGDLVTILREVRSRGASSVAAVGHSVGGVVAIGAALADPGACDSLGAFEPPMPWLGFRRVPPGQDRPQGWTPVAKDPAYEVERFFSAMVSPLAWRRLSEAGKAGRRADGLALVADLLSLREDPPFDVTALTVPALFGLGGPSSADHHRDSVAWLGAHVPGAAVYEIGHANHGAHLSHPDHFAAFVRAVVARAPTA
jgi:pimeloyl-ACP methyl ester carboxylesterase